MKLYDISVPLRPGLPHWPGEKGFQRSETVKDDVTVSEIQLGLHTGTHLDAPNHFLPDAWNLDRVPLTEYVGKARVVEIQSKEAITRAELEKREWAGVERVLFRTPNAGLLDKDEFEPGFVALAKDGAEFLVSRGIRLIGTDYLSIEGFKGDGTVHRILLKQNIVILEGLDLRGIAEGDYFLVALPLKIAGAEASPTRAILLEGVAG